MDEGVRKTKRKVGQEKKGLRVERNLKINNGVKSPFEL